ncbi:hypothetical protein J1N35_033869 [Gossypium stocksii]|uniref:Uncharacterized protein n=1 Tax=Gossypium stocksii TaxID=47602 RepID=A0A9D3USX5_9ROSI|nr:hypothetical protein J1N35_033869 [Gossypium stocksii]
MGQTDPTISKWQTRWIQEMGDILICLVQQNGWLTPTPLLDMFIRFPPLDKKDDNDGREDDDDDGNDDDDDDEEKKEEEIPITPLNYARVFQPEHPSTKGVVIHDPSHHNPTLTLKYVLLKHRQVVRRVKKRLWRSWS